MQRQIYLRFAQQLIYIIQAILYWMHFIIRLFVRSVAGPFMCVSIMLPALLFVLFLYSVWSLRGRGFVAGFMSCLEEYRTIKTLISAIISLGGLAYLITKSKKTIRTARDAIKENLAIDCGKDWVPKFETTQIETTERLRKTWKYVECTFSKTWGAFKSSIALVLSMMILVLVSAVGYMQVREGVEWQKEVIENQKEVMKKVDGIRERPAVQQVWIVTESPVVFSLVYPPHANLDTKEGICPDEYNRKWLKLFKNAIRECAKRESPLKLEVRAFSSVAPVAVAGNYDQSDQWNCEIANQRAEAVVGFLTSTEEINEEACETILANSKWRHREREPCTRQITEIQFGSGDELPVDVIYRPWQQYKDMIDVRPVNDGRVGHQRIHELEFLNRVVQIIVKNDSCWREEWLRLDR